VHHLALALSFLLFCCTLNAYQNEPRSSLMQMKKANPTLGLFLDELTNFQTKELQLVAGSQHATRLRFQTDEAGVIFQNRPVVILIHGLFDSPVTMEKLENYVFENGAHVISLRLPGHHEKDPTNLDRVGKLHKTGATRLQKWDPPVCMIGSQWIA
jgi:hypothetical protein